MIIETYEITTVIIISFILGFFVGCFAAAKVLPYFMSKEKKYIEGYR